MTTHPNEPRQRHPRNVRSVHSPFSPSGCSDYQQIEIYLFTPQVSAKTMDVSPAMALAAVVVGAAIWGPLGALVGIPLAAAAGVSILQTYQQSYDLVPEAAAHVGDTSKRSS